MGMCGGIVSALSLGLPGQPRRSAAQQLPFQLAYNAGRILSYSFAGAIMGGAGALLVQYLPLQIAQKALLLLGAALMLLLGLYLGGWWRILGRLEQAGGLLWRKIQPLSRRLLPITSLPRALAVGLVWGWVPCGLVYSMLINAVAAGSAGQGALVMLAFAAGTLPNLLAIGLLVGAASHLFQHTLARQIAAITIILFGVITAWRALSA